MIPSGLPSFHISDLPRTFSVSGFPQGYKRHKIKKTKKRLSIHDFSRTTILSVKSHTNKDISRFPGLLKEEFFLSFLSFFSYSSSLIPPIVIKALCKKEEKRKASIGPL